MTTPTIATFSVAKRYGNAQPAVDGVSLSVQPGEIYGFCGLNGAGKSTMIRMLLGMVAPTSGHTELFGQRVHAGATQIWRRVGCLVDTATAYPELTVRENLEVARLLQLSSDRTCVRRMIDALALGPYTNQRARTLSLGNLQRLALARALLHQPELLILDEPANALDPAGIAEIRELLRSLSHERGVTIFMSSHVLAEVERLATRIGIMDRGRMIEQLDIAGLELRRERRLEIAVRDLVKAEAVLVEAGFSPRKGRSNSIGNPSVLELSEARALEAPDLVAGVLSAHGVPPMRIALVQQDLEQHFLRIAQQGEVANEGP